MSREFDHVIVTRFSVRFAVNQEPPSEEWLWRRLDLFRATTVASIDRQSAQRFSWVVFFDDRVDERFVEAVAELAADRFTPVWTSDFFDGELVAKHLLELGHSAPWLITSRVDNDDCLAKDFVAEVQTIFDGQSDLFVNFVRGFQQVEGGQVYRYDSLSNPFISRIERVHDGTAKTVFEGKHFEAQRLADVMQVATKPMWSQTIHAGNMMNQVRGRLTTVRSLRERIHNELTAAAEAPVAGFSVHFLQTALVALPRLWMQEPRFAKEWLRTRADLARGTHTKTRAPR